MKQITLYLLLFFLHLANFAQSDFDCQKVDPFLNSIEKRILNISTSDPELITLHYLFTKDISIELSDFYTKTIPQLSNCPEINFYKVINQYDWAKQTNQKLLDSLAILKEYVDQMFYQQSYIEYNLKHYNQALYLVDRSLQFKELQADPLLLKLEILFQLKMYQESIDVLNTIYYQIKLNGEQEKKTIDFNLKFYDHLYKVGDSLINIDKATEAFKIFKLLETFCNNMPSGYCNDDYYHGLLKSKVGVYESYLKIANVARERENFDMEAKFLQYAEEYLNSNQEILFEMQLEEKKVEYPTPSIDTNHKEIAIIPKESSKDTIAKTPITKKKDTITNTPIATKKDTITNTPEMIYKNYQRLVSDAIDLCIQEEFDAAFDKFILAQMLEECNCFIKDARIELFLNELRKIRKK